MPVEFPDCKTFQRYWLSSVMLSSDLQNVSGDAAPSMLLEFPDCKMFQRYWLSGVMLSSDFAECFNKSSTDASFTGELFEHVSGDASPSMPLECPDCQMFQGYWLSSVMLSSDFAECFKQILQARILHR